MLVEVEAVVLGATDCENMPQQQHEHAVIPPTERKIHGRMIMSLFPSRVFLRFRSVCVCVSWPGSHSSGFAAATSRQSPPCSGGGGGGGDHPMMGGLS